MIQAGKKAGACIQCGVSLVNWTRVHRCDLSDVPYTFRALKYEFVRHYFWHKTLSQKAINHAKRKGKRQLRQRIRQHLENAIGPAKPFHDGFQTPMADNLPTALPYAQHATATCCRKCLEYWHGIPVGRNLHSSELDYLSELVFRYIEDRVPDLAEEGEYIPPIRNS
jgi:hypothetical protein